LDDALRARIVAARASVREILERAGDPGVSFYDPDKVNPAAPLRDNLLFGRISHSAANAQPRVTEAISAVINDLGFRSDIERVGLDHQVGPAGRLLNATQRASINLVRCIVKRPDVFAVDGALAPFGETRARHLLHLLLDMFSDRTLVVVLPNDRDTDGLDAVVRFRDAKAELELRRDAAQEEKADWTVPEEGIERRVAGGVS
jgi:putative ABC transport system ATP-binding protein